MTKFLIKLFIKDKDNIRSTKVRNEYGRLAGIVGIITNSLISLLKIGIGMIVNSIAIVADGINNLMDATSSVITLVGFKMATKKRDKEHPYGHARYEYITGIIVSIIIIVVGFQLMITSIGKIRNPELINFNYWIIAILLFSIGVKVWQALFYYKLGKSINSATLKATAIDSRNDVITTAAVLISVVVDHLTGFGVDGYMGVLVALFIVYSGVSLIKETSSPLLGQAPDPVLVKSIGENIMSYTGVLGVHDLAVHDYGPGNIFATVHIEVDSHEDILKSHELIDDIEIEVGSKLGIDLIGHMDPIDIKDPLINDLNKLIGVLTAELPDVIDFHDLRIVKGDSHTNVIFDVVLAVDSTENKAAIRKYLQNGISKYHPSLNLVVTYDLDYTNFQR